MPATIHEYRAEYNKADGFLQEVQGFIDEAGIPALNELRNAGLHFLKSVDDAGQLVNDGELTSAISHAKRACYEASEAGILAALEIIYKFKTDYQNYTVGPVLSNYSEILKSSSSAQKDIETQRAIGNDRSRDHQTRMETFRKLRGYATDLDIAREQMNVIVEEKRTSSRRFIIGACLTLLAIAVTITIAIVKH